MKKSILKLTIILLITTYLTGCFRFDETIFLCDCGKVEIDKKEYIAMCVIPDIVTENSVSYLRIENHTKHNISYGEDFYMEYFNKNNWEPIPFDFYFNSMLYGTDAGEITINQRNLYSLSEKYNNAKEGKYRIIKEVIKDIKLVAEFEVK